MLLNAFLIPLLFNFGSAGDSYFVERRRMLRDATVTFYPQAKESKTDERHYNDSALPIPHNYKLIINEPDICSQHHQVFLFVLVRSLYSHFQWRTIIREQLTHKSPVFGNMGIVVKHVFLFGASPDPSVMKLLKQESDDYRDIIQEDFLESYINLTLKVPMGYKWVVNYCPNAEYVMVANDELSLDVDKMVSFLLKDYSMGRYDDHFAICFPIGNSPALHKGIKQFQKLDPKILYQGDFYPPYCHGFGYAAHIQVINKLYRATTNTPPFMPSDVWIGVMSEKVGLQIPNHAQLFILENFEAYYADPNYPILPGTIAVTDFEGNKGRELQTLQTIIQSMRTHWKNNRYLQDHLFQVIKEHSSNRSRYIYILVGVTLFIIIFRKHFMNILGKLRNHVSDTRKE